MTTKGPAYKDHNGFKMPAGFPVDNFDNSLQYQVEDTDIIVTTYPKCGTTWVQNIVYLILHDGNPVPPEQKLTKLFPHLEEVGKEAIESLEHPRLIKTHLPYEMTPMNTKAKYIYVARNPKDCLVSFFHHTKGFIKAYDYEHGVFDDYFELFLNGEVDFGDYFDNLCSWMTHRTEPHILWLSFEELKQDIEKGILKIATFLGYEKRLLENDREILTKVQENSSFTSMKKETQRWSSKRPEGHTSFIRKGVVGVWANHFSAEQNERMNTKIHQRLTSAELETLWPQLNF